MNANTTRYGQEHYQAIVGYLQSEANYKISARQIENGRTAFAVLPVKRKLPYSAAFHKDIDRDEKVGYHIPVRSCGIRQLIFEIRSLQIYLLWQTRRERRAGETAIVYVVTFLWIKYYM